MKDFGAPSSEEQEKIFKQFKAEMMSNKFFRSIVQIPYKNSYKTIEVHLLGEAFQNEALVHALQQQGIKFERGMAHTTPFISIDSQNLRLLDIQRLTKDYQAKRELQEQEKSEGEAKKKAELVGKRDSIKNLATQINSNDVFKSWAWASTVTHEKREWIIGIPNYLEISYKGENKALEQALEQQGISFVIEQRKDYNVIVIATEKNPNLHLLNLEKLTKDYIAYKEEHIARERAQQEREEQERRLKEEERLAAVRQREQEEQARRDLEARERQREREKREREEQERQEQAEQERRRQETPADRAQREREQKGKVESAKRFESEMNTNKKRFSLIQATILSKPDCVQLMSQLDEISNRALAAALQQQGIKSTKQVISSFGVDYVFLSVDVDENTRGLYHFQIDQLIKDYGAEIQKQKSEQEAKAKLAAEQAQREAVLAQDRLIRQQAEQAEREAALAQERQRQQAAQAELDRVEREQQEAKARREREQKEKAESIKRFEDQMNSNKKDFSLLQATLLSNADCVQLLSQVDEISNNALAAALQQQGIKSTKQSINYGGVDYVCLSVDVKPNADRFQHFDIKKLKKDYDAEIQKQKEEQAARERVRRDLEREREAAVEQQRLRQQVEQAERVRAEREQQAREEQERQRKLEEQEKLRKREEQERQRKLEEQEKLRKRAEQAERERAERLREQEIREKEKEEARLRQEQDKVKPEIDVNQLDKLQGNLRREQVALQRIIKQKHALQEEINNLNETVSQVPELKPLLAEKSAELKTLDGEHEKLLKSQAGYLEKIKEITESVGFNAEYQVKFKKLKALDKEIENLKDLVKEIREMEPVRQEKIAEAARLRPTVVLFQKVFTTRDQQNQEATRLTEASKKPPVKRGM